MTYRTRKLDRERLEQATTRLKDCDVVVIDPGGSVAMIAMFVDRDQLRPRENAENPRPPLFPAPYPWDDLADCP